MTPSTPNSIVALTSRIREKANRFIQKELNERGFPEIRPSHGSILWVLFTAAEAPTMAEIVRRVGRSKSTISVSLRTLEKYGYLAIRPSPGDARETRIHLTDTGRSLEKDYLDISEKISTRIAEGFSSGDLELLSTLLLRVDDNLSK